ncbi:hypothetical protein FJY84_03525 [Candidatus Bathyarchaeota archaeon]|nr:hypothetical protein [Candidatus Bathyarchaeota archaeon]
MAKVKEAEIEPNEKDVRALLSGKFSLQDMYDQFEAMRKMGPLQKVFGMIPGLGYQLPKEEMEKAEERLDKWKVIIQSMTKEEKEDPKILNSSRIRRAARGSGLTEADVRELIKNYENTKKMFKQFKGNRRMRQMPFKIG